MPVPHTLVGIIITVLLVGFVVSYAPFPGFQGQNEKIREFQNSISGSLDEATSSGNPIYAVISIGAASLSTFLIAATSIGTFLGVFLDVGIMPADYYIISVVMLVGLSFGVIRYIRGMFDV